jgi:adenylosuccinate synthase
MSYSQHSEVVLTNGLTIGEEAKGATVEWLTQLLQANLVLRSGGCQAGHHIVTEDGREQQFSHYSCGTFEGAHTHLKHMVIDPFSLFEEAMELEAKGVVDALKMITIDQDNLVITPYHGALSRIKELYRGKDKKGTIGLGVGDAVKDAREGDELALKAADLLLEASALRQKVEKIRQRKMEQAREIIAASPLWDYIDFAESQVLLFEDEALVGTIVESFKLLAELVQVVDRSYLQKALNRKGAIVGESSHGVLLHPYYGFVPHVTQIDSAAEDVLQTISEHKHTRRVIRIGIARSYMTRHGAGPMVSYSPEMTKSLKETHNAASAISNEWLGEFLSGQFDTVAMKYSIAASGTQLKYDGLMLNYMDALQGKESWEVVQAYTYHGQSADDLATYFELAGDQIVGIKVRPNTKDEAQVAHQARLTELLKHCKPVLTSLTPTETKTLEQVFIEYVEQQTGVPVIGLSRGPKSSDRELTAAGKKLFRMY